MLFCRSCFQPWFHSDMFWSLSFFCFVLSNQYYLSKSIYEDFHCQKISFLCKHNFCIDEKNAQWHWDTKVKVFHESISWFMKCPWNCISWNALKEIFQCILLFRNFTKFKRKHLCHGLIKLQASWWLQVACLKLYLKRDCGTGALLWILRNF